MTQAWFLQANPEVYDIDGALQHVSLIGWRIPQYTGQVAFGDIVVLWRAGEDAGIVGLGRVEGPPYVGPRSEDESPFVRADSEFRATTRVPVRITPTALVPKRAIAAMPAFRDHPILVAPRGTVFPLSDAQWRVLARMLPTPPDAPPRNFDPEAWPVPFAWDQRGRSVYPLPGGYAGYLTSLQSILAHVAEVHPEKPEFAEWMRATFGSSVNAADLVRVFLTRISLLRESRGVLHLTDEAQGWSRTQDPAFAIALLHSRVRFIGEMLAFLDRPAAIEDIRQYANAEYGMVWSTRAQVDRRRGWLQSAGMLHLNDEGKLAIAPAGEELLARLDVAPRPLPSAQLPSSTDADIVPSSATAAVEVVGAAATSLMSSFRRAATNTADSTEFERLTAEVFRSLGFVAEHLGGSGNTDVLVIAPLGPGDGYRVTIDCKTTSHEAVSDAQIDWITLQEHRTQHQAEFSAVIGPAFRASRVEQRARAARVVLLDVDGIAGLCAQHAEVPLGLDVYRRIFDPSETAALEAVASIAEEERRWLTLTAEVIRVINELQSSEGPLVARDVYWNVSRDLDATVSVGDIELTIAALASPAIGLLREAGGGFISLGSLASSLQRLRRLSDLLISERSEPTDA